MAKLRLPEMSLVAIVARGGVRLENQMLAEKKIHQVNMLKLAKINSSPQRITSVSFWA